MGVEGNKKIQINFGNNKNISSNTFKETNSDNFKKDSARKYSLAQSIFKRYDLNGDGTLDEKELNVVQDQLYKYSNDGTLGKREARKFIEKELGMGGLEYEREDLYEVMFDMTRNPQNTKQNEDNPYKDLPVEDIVNRARNFITGKNKKEEAVFDNEKGPKDELLDIPEIEGDSVQTEPKKDTNVAKKTQVSNTQTSKTTTNVSPKSSQTSKADNNKNLKAKTNIANKNSSKTNNKPAIKKKSAKNSEVKTPNSTNKTQKTVDKAKKTVNKPTSAAGRDQKPVQNSQKNKPYTGPLEKTTQVVTKNGRQYVRVSIMNSKKQISEKIYYEDKAGGTIGLIEDYDSSGAMTKSFSYKNGKLDHTIEYKNGKIYKQRFYNYVNNGNTEIVSEYNSKNEFVKRTAKTYQNGKLKQVEEYNSKKELIMRATYTQQQKVAHWYENKKEIKTDYFKINGKKEKLTYTETMQYDASGKFLKSKTRFDGNGAILARSTYHYNKKDDSYVVKSCGYSKSTPVIFTATTYKGNKVINTQTYDDYYKLYPPKNNYNMALTNKPKIKRSGTYNPEANKSYAQRATHKHNKS